MDICDEGFTEKIIEYIRIRKQLIEYIRKHFPTVDIRHDDFFVNEITFLLRANL